MKGSFFKNIFDTQGNKRTFFTANLRKAVKVLQNKYSHLKLKTHFELPAAFKYDAKRALPRGKVDKAGNCYSYGYELEFNELPPVVSDFILFGESVLEAYFSNPVSICKPLVFRNLHLPDQLAGQDFYSEVFHQDLVVDQYNAQLFILLQDVHSDEGPFEFLDHRYQRENFGKFNTRGVPPTVIPDSQKLTGKRGDALLFSTGNTLHRATSPHYGKHRDLLSIAFFPEYAKRGQKIEPSLFDRGMK